MTDRIAELRSLVEGIATLRQQGVAVYLEAASALQEELYESTDALLDCAEALRALLSYTKACEELLNVMPAGQIHIAEEALAKLNGESDED